jgi:hypothetical protein
MQFINLQVVKQFHLIFGSLFRQLHSHLYPEDSSFIVGQLSYLFEICRQINSSFTDCKLIQLIDPLLFQPITKLSIAVLHVTLSPSPPAFFATMLFLKSNSFCRNRHRDVLFIILLSRNCNNIFDHLEIYKASKDQVEEPSILLLLYKTSRGLFPYPCLSSGRTLQFLIMLVHSLRVILLLESQILQQ